MRIGRYQYLFPEMTPAVKYLLLANSIIFIVSLVLPLKLSALFGLAPASVWKGAIWQVFTYMFLHGGFFHLIFNMVVLWMFGTALESAWGLRRFLVFYFICGIGAGLLNIVATPGSHMPVVGASGAIYGLLMAFGILFPDQIIYLWGIVPIRAKYFVIGLGVVELLTAMSTTQTGIAHIAHLGGMLFGLLYLKWPDWKRMALSWQSEKRRRKHLTVVWSRDQEKKKLQAEIDRLLDKIGREGMESLTEEEHELFRKTSRKMTELEDRH